MDDGAGDQLREEQNEKRVIEKVEIADFALIGISEQCDFLKREKGDAKREHNLRDKKVEPEKRVQIINEEVDVFEIAENTEISHDGEDEHRSPKTSWRC